MDLEKQCCNLDYSRQLKELGVAQESLFYHTHSEKWGILSRKNIDFTGDPTSAFTLAELIQMNEGAGSVGFTEAFTSKENKFYSIGIGDTRIYQSSFADAVALQIIKSIENKWTTVENLNELLLV